MTLSRTERIKLRAERYAKGEIDLKTFFDLESLDEEPEDETPDKPVPAITPDPVPVPKKITRKKINITKEDFDKLSLHDQQEMYNADPEAIEALVKGDD